MHRLFSLLSLATLVLFSASLLIAQDEKPTEEKPATEKPAAEKPAEEKPTEEAKPAETPAEPATEQSEWDKLSARKLEIAQTLQKLGKEFQSANVERKLEIRTQYEELILEFQGQVLPAMTELAAVEFEKNPKNADAAEILLRDAYARNDYPAVIAVGEKLVATDQGSPVVWNFLGAGYFAEHQFEKAVEVLSKAEAQDKLDVRVGGRYLDPAKEYVELWQAEQAIREVEAALEGDEKLPVVEFDTPKGKIVMELFENQAPNTVANFISLIESGTYDGVKFHRVIPNFMVQTGDPNSKDEDPNNDGLGGPGYTIACECFEDDARKHFSGSLSMAHAGKDTGGSQFFITHQPTPHLNPNSGNESNHTVFGRVTEGLDVVRKIEKDDVIEKASVVSKRDHEYKPETTAKPDDKKPAPTK